MHRLRRSRVRLPRSGGVRDGDGHEDWFHGKIRRLDLDESIFKPQDIWNINATFKAEAIESLTPMQALMRYLNESPKWYVDPRKKEHNDKLAFLFFIPECMQKLLREHPEILIMNYTYETNRYKLNLAEQKT